jgi:hypothetical protein
VIAILSEFGRAEKGQMSPVVLRILVEIEKREDFL